VEQNEIPVEDGKFIFESPVNESIFGGKIRVEISEYIVFEGRITRKMDNFPLNKRLSTLVHSLQKNSIPGGKSFYSIGFSRFSVNHEATPSQPGNVLIDFLWNSGEGMDIKLKSFHEIFEMIQVKSFEKIDFLLFFKEHYFCGKPFEKEEEDPDFFHYCNALILLFDFEIVKRVVTSENGIDEFSNLPIEFAIELLFQLKTLYEFVKFVFKIFCGESLDERRKGILELIQQIMFQKFENE
jgi:hypothetical protein